MNKDPANLGALQNERRRQVVARKINAGRRNLRPRQRICLGHLDVGEGPNPVRSILLFLLGVPIPIILLLAMCTHHF